MSTRLSYSDIPPEIRHVIERTIREFEVLPDGTSYQAVSADRGNWTGGAIGAGRLVGTNWGVAAPTYAGWLGIDPDTLTGDTMQAMTLHEAAEIGYAMFFAAPRLDRLPWSRAVELLFDWGWGSGPATAVREMQRVIGVLPDGCIGPRTVVAWTSFIARLGMDRLLRDLVHARIAMSRADVARHPEQRRFLPLWIHRYQSFLLGEAA